MIIGIVAVDRNGAIGKDGQLPWHYSADMRHFKETTLGHACLMGHNTWLTLKKPLVNRLNIVLSRRSNIDSQELVVLLRDVESALALNRDLKSDMFVIGGAQIFREFLPHIDKWIVTEVPLTIPDADTFMPPTFLEGFRNTAAKELEQNLVVKYYERS